MKYWQEYGEVLDSEDDEIHLQLQPVASRPTVKDLTRQHGKPTSCATAYDIESNKENTGSCQSEISVQCKVAPIEERPGRLRSVNRPNALREAHQSKSLLTLLSQDDSSQQSSTIEPSLQGSQDNTTPVESVWHLASGASSPLTDLSRTPSPARPSTADSSIRLATTHVLQEDLEHQEILDILEAEKEQIHPPQARNLRQRTTKQLHPFLEEQARYLQLCRDRGMRPLRILDATASHVETPLEDGTQSSEAYSTIDSQTQQPHSTQGDDFPDDSAVDRRLLDGVQSGHKRRKTSRADDSSHHATFYHPLISPPSSPIDKSVVMNPPKVDRPRFRPPPGMTPRISLPTPVVSSEPRSAPILLKDTASSRSKTKSSSPNEEAGMLVITSDSESSTDSETSMQPLEKAVEKQLTAQKKRIKGVLPASWLKIDLQAQQKQVLAQHQLAHHDEVQSPSLPSKGIARKIARSRFSRTVSGTVAMLSDAGLSSDSGAETRQSYNRQLTLHVDGGINHDDFVNVDDMEHDWIDRLLPGSRSHKRANDHFKQPRIRDALQQPAKHERRGCTLDISEHPPGTASRHRQQHGRPTNIAPRLSILDTVSPTSAYSSAPLFIRLATRRARKMPGKARQSPRSKHIRLATQNDTNDAQTTLHQWREGVMQQRALAGPAQPVSVSHNRTKQQPQESVKKRRAKTKHIERGRPRPAQLESLESERSDKFRAMLFREQINAMSRQRVLSDDMPSMPPAPTRILIKTRQANAEQSSKPAQSMTTAIDQEYTTHSMKRPRCRKKQHTHRMVVEPIESEQQVTNLDDNDLQYHQSEHFEVHLGVYLDTSRLPFPLNTDFGIGDLSPGLKFSTDSFIGSGDFMHALNFDSRSLSTHNGKISLRLDDETVEWAAWTDEVKSRMMLVPEIVVRAIAMLEDSSASSNELISNINLHCTYALRSLVRYCTHCLYFLDPIDRRDCVDAISRLCEELRRLSNIEVLQHTQVGFLKALILQYTLVLSAQTNMLAQNDLVTCTQRSAIQELFRFVATSLAIHVHKAGVEQLARENEAIRSGGHILDASSTCSILMLQHTMKVDRSGTTFWQIFNSVLAPAEPDMMDADSIEQIWRFTFTITPILRLNEHGKAMHQSYCSVEDWSLLQTTMKRIFELYPSTVRLPGNRINYYIRSLFVRSTKLITQWRWRKCESWLAIIYDFFVQRKLEVLHGEILTGSPAFLDDLHDDLRLAFQPSDVSYHIFLKMLAIGLKGMQNYSAYSSRKIASILWRFIPGNPRIYHKDAMLEQVDLDSLRNHYDLLCTLYSAAPAGLRLPIHVLTGLVSHQDSHRAACHISIRAWTCLMSFEASLNEGRSMIDNFTTWFNDIVSTSVAQYKLARTEAEDDYHRLRANNATVISIDYVETIVANNQRQVVATLVDVLAGMKRTIYSAKDAEILLHIAEHCNHASFLSNLAITDRALKSVFLEGLEIVQAYAVRVRKAQQNSQQTEDSQDYGDDIRIASSTTNGANASRSITSLIIPVMRQLLSNAFGADQSPEDVVLSKALDAWLALLYNMVQDGQIAWDNVIEGYGDTSWRELRDTSQYRSFTPYLLAKILDFGADLETLPYDKIIIAWVKSLVQRESLLKYQHKLTSAILNTWSNEVLLTNLPIAQTGTGEYDVSMHELRQCRLALLSTIFANMRDDLENLNPTTRGTLQDRRRMYANILRKMMSSLRGGYLEGQGSGDTNMVQIHGVYVEFVQRIVSMMQQYTSGICAIDKFFTDSTAFPLPVDDPTYAVGRLRSYTSRLSQTKHQKELATFIRNLGERALIDGQQDYLIDQLSLAVGLDIEEGDLTHPSLRYYMCVVVFPAYITLMGTHMLGWCLGTMMLSAAQRTVKAMLCCLDVNNSTSIEAIESMLSSILSATIRLMKHKIARADLEDYKDGFALVQTIQLCCDSLVVIEYLGRLTKQLLRSSKLAYELRKACCIHERQLIGDDLDEQTYEDIDIVGEDTHLSNTREYLLHELQQSLNSDWVDQGTSIAIRRGGIVKVIQQHTSDKRASNQDIKEALQSYVTQHSRLFNRRPQPRHEEASTTVLVI